MATPMTSSRRKHSVAIASLRFATIALLACAVCDLAMPWSTSRRCVVFVLDRSASVTATPRRTADDYVARAMTQLSGEDVGRLAFAGAARVGAATDSPDDTSPDDAPPNDISPDDAALEADATDVEAALETAATRLRPGRVPEVVLLSDGRATTGDALRAAQSLRQRGVWVSVVPLDASPDPEVFVDSVRVAGVLRAGRPTEVTVALGANRPVEAEVVVEAEGVAVRRRVTLGPGGSIVRLPVVFAHATQSPLCVRITGASDSIAGNNRMSASARVLPPARALVVERQSNAARRLVDGLRRGGIEVESRLPAQLPGNAAALAAWDALVLVDLPSAALTQRESAAIAAWVRRERGGLVVVGGPHSLTAGGYRGTSLESLLPVVCETTSPAQRPATAVVLIVDRSQSMASGGAIDMAKEAVRRTVAMLRPDDQLGVLAFNETSRWIIPPARLSDKRAALAAVDALSAEGRTHMAAAMQKGLAALDAAFAGRKHAILLTDGVSQPGDFAGIARKAAGRGITLSTVALGREASRPLLAELAKIGGGRAYACDDPAAMPAVFAVETAAALPLGIQEQPVSPRADKRSDRSAGLSSVLELPSMPGLLGYVETRPRPEAVVVLSVGRDSPLLARWQCGSGAVAVFTSDVEDRWTPAWAQWPDGDRFWAAVVDSVLAPLPSGDAATTGYAAEYRPAPPDRELLRRIAETTGGRYDPSVQQLSAPTGRTAPCPIRLRPWLLAAAALLLVMEIALRRW